MSTSKNQNNENAGSKNRTVVAAKNSSIPESKFVRAPIDQNAPILTICIPTYKRGKYVDAQVKTIFAHILPKFGDQVEVIVVDNVSPDDTSVRLSKYQHPSFKVIRREKHYDTAEENMMRSVDFLRGTYVWFLGDDDVVNVSNVGYVIELLMEKKYDCFVFNSTTISPRGGLALLQPMPMNGLSISGSIGTVVESIGLIYTFAGLSNVIQRRENLSCENGLEWTKASKIYSHVAWFVDSNKSSHVAFYNLPLVFYRQNDYSDGHWERVAEKQKVQDMYFWSLGLVRLLNRLVQRGCFTYAQAGGIFELAGDGSRYALIDDIVFKTYNQMMLSINDSSKRQQLSLEDIEEIGNFLLSVNPLLFDVVTLLYDAHDNLQRPDVLDLRPTIAQKFSDRFMELYNLRQSMGQFCARFVGKFHGFEIYAMPQQFVGVTAADIGLRERVLRIVDPVPDNMRVIVGNDLAGICETAREVREKATTLATLQEHLPAAGGGGTSAVNVQFPMEEIRALINENSATTRSLVHQLTALYNSTSWTITSPIRKIVTAMRRGRK